VTLIDTAGQGLERITSNGIVHAGIEYAVDCIVYATGFEFGVAASRSGGFEVYAPDGSTLSESRANGVHSLHGIQIGGFPNLFVIGGLHHAGVSINIPLVFGDQGRHVAELIRVLQDRGAARVDVRPEAEQQWAEVIAQRSIYNVEAARSCTPGAYNNENTFEPGEPSVFATAYGGGPIEYAEVLGAWRANDLEADLEIRRVAELQEDEVR
jgi:hypothetical protein